MSIVIAIIVIFLAMCVAAWVVSGMAKVQKEIVVDASPVVLAERIRAQFNELWWPATQGQGQLNFRARGLGLAATIKTKPTLSIDLTPRSDGSVAVQVWMSAWGTQAGMVGLADRVVLKRAKLLRALRASDGITSESPTA